MLGRGHPARATGGLRRPATAVPVITEAVLPPTARPSPRPRPSPVPRDARPEPELVFVEVDRARVLRSLLVAPPLLLVLGLTLFALVANSGRLGFDLSGGRLLPVGDLGATWSEYLAAWHPVSGGTTSPASASLAVLGTLGVLFGGPATLVALVLLFDAPIAALAAYVATRRMRVRRPVRAVVAAAYALLPAATSAVSQGRLDVVVVHVLAPLVFTGVLGVLRGAGGRAWLPIVSGTAFAAAAIGAFSPLVHLAVVVGALVGFVVLPGNPGEGRRSRTPWSSCTAWARWWTPRRSVRWTWWPCGPEAPARSRSSARSWCWPRSAVSPCAPTARCSPASVWSCWACSPVPPCWPSRCPRCPAVRPATASPARPSSCSAGACSGSSWPPAAATARPQALASGTWCPWSASSPSSAWRSRACSVSARVRCGPAPTSSRRPSPRSCRAPAAPCWSSARTANRPARWPVGRRRSATTTSSRPPPAPPG